MAKKMLSIEIGCSTTKIVEMDFQAKKPKIYKCVEFKTPGEAINDGYLDPARAGAMKDALKYALRENKIRTKRALFTVFSTKIITREIVIPGVKQNQIHAVIESNLTEYFPIELDDYKVTHMHISTFREGDNAGKHKVLVIAAENALLSGYEKLASELGLNLVDIDYAGNSIYQAVRQSAGAEAVMAVKVEDENALITIIKQGTLMMQRTVNYNLGRQEDDQVSPDEAAEVLVGTMLRVMDFYTSNNEGNGVEQIYVIGEGSKNRMLLDTVREEIQFPSRALDTVRGVVLGRKAENARMNVFAPAIGAGLKSVGFDADKEKERHETNYASACVLMVFFYVAVIAALLSIALIPYNMAVLEQGELERKRQQYEPARLVHDQYLGMKSLVEKVRYGNMLTERSNDGILVFLSELEDKLPSDVEVTEFSSDDEQCVITMRVADKETAAGVIKMLREFDTLTDVTVQNITEESLYEGEGTDVSLENADATIVYFSVNCVYQVIEHVDPAVAVPESAANTADVG